MNKKKYKIYKKKSGTLIPFYLQKDVPIKTKRIFIIYGKKNFYRGDHAHYKCSQYLVPIFGSMMVEYENATGRYKKKLSLRKKEGLLLKPKTWCKISFKTDNSMIMVFCDRDYEYKDYIENYNQFLRIIKKFK